MTTKDFRRRLTEELVDERDALAINNGFDSDLGSRMVGSWICHGEASGVA